MESFDSRFAAWAEDLVPGLPDPGRVVKGRILYRAAEDAKAAARKPGLRGDTMDVDPGADLGDLVSLDALDRDDTSKSLMPMEIER